MKAKISFITLQIISALSCLLFLALGIVGAFQKETATGIAPVYYQANSGMVNSMMQGCPHWLCSIAIFWTIGFVSFAFIQFCSYKVKKGGCKSAEHQVS